MASHAVCYQKANVTLASKVTGSPFTCDYTDIILYQTLYKHNDRNYPESVSNEDKLKSIYATANDIKLQQNV